MNRRYTFAPRYKPPEPKKPRDFSRFRISPWPAVALFLFALPPLLLWSMLFGTPSDGFLRVFFGLLLIFGLGFYRIGGTAIIILCIYWLL